MVVLPRARASNIRRSTPGSGSDLETITTGRLFAASPRSANQTSPGSRFIENVQYVLFHGPRANHVKSIVVRQFDDLSYNSSDFVSCGHSPTLKLLIQFLRDGIHFHPHQFSLYRKVHGQRLEDVWTLNFGDAHRILLFKNSVCVPEIPPDKDFDRNGWPSVSGSSVVQG